MLGLDTNILVRFLAEDDDLQTQQAKAVMVNRANQPLYLSMLVLAEAFTVMTKVKKFPAASVLGSYRLLMRSPQVIVERPDMVTQAIADAEATGAGLPDALIALQNSEASCTTTVTFDRRATRLALMSPAEEHL